MNVHVLSATFLLFQKYLPVDKYFCVAFDMRGHGRLHPGKSVDSTDLIAGGSITERNKGDLSRDTLVHDAVEVLKSYFAVVKPQNIVLVGHRSLILRFR